MKATYYFPNIFLTALAAVFVLIGAGVYINNHPAKPTFDPITYPVTDPAPAAVLSQETTSPQEPITSTENLQPVPDTQSVSSIIYQVLLGFTGQGSIKNLLSSDLSELYSREDIETALGVARLQYGPVQSIYTLGNPNITGDFADQAIEITTSQGKYRYQVFLHREQGSWKLMGTEPLP